MVKVVFESNNINDVFESDIELNISENRKRAVYTDDTTEGELIFVGSNFSRLGDTVLLGGGRVEKLVIMDENGDLAGTLTGADIKATDLSDAFAADGLNGLLAVLLGGKDEIIGSDDADQLFGFGRADEIKGRKGEDFIVGGRGNDVMTGGQHADTFYFVPAQDGKGDDVITDFDVIGEVTDFLAIDGDEIDKIARANQNQDTLLTLGGGSTILLEDVRRADFLGYLVT